MRRKRQTIFDVWKYINKGREDSCWECNHCPDKDGYGRMCIDYKTIKCHRLVYELTFGPIPDGLFVLHKCNNPKCCNPNHLYIGTAKENNNQCLGEGRFISSLGERNGQSKLTAQNIIDIKKLYSSGEYYQKDLGKIFGVKISQISRIINKKRWKHISKEK